MHNPHDEGISIWFFIGILLTIYGVMILGADIYYQGQAPTHQVVLSELRAGLWGGAILLLMGIGYCVKFRPGKAGN